MGGYRKYTQELLQEAVDASDTMAGVLRHLGLQQTGGGQAHISRTIKAFGIDTSHFKGQGWLKGQKMPPRRSSDFYLQLHPVDSPRVKGTALRRALIGIGRPYTCEGCGNPGEWCGLPLTLHVDHINGLNVDCRAENLRFLCPNCHSQTATHAGRNKRRKTE